MRKLLAAILASMLAVAVSPIGAIAARNPSGTGPPSQSCQEIEKAEMEAGEAPRVPGHSSSSIGSPFNEPELNTPEGGVGGAHYSEKAQYDVACFQASTHQR
jgi:hypothetical protein